MSYTFDNTPVTTSSGTNPYSYESALESLTDIQRTSAVSNESLTGDIDAVRSIRTLDAVTQFCSETLHMVKDPADTQGTSTESLMVRYTPVNLTNANAGVPAGNQVMSALVDLCRKCHVPESNIYNHAALAARSLYFPFGTETYSSPSAVTTTYGVNGNRGTNWVDVPQGLNTNNTPISLESYYPGHIAAKISQDAHAGDRIFNTEAFGQDVNHLPVENRLTMALVIERPNTSFMDRAFARVPCKEGHICITIPWAEVYNLDNSNSPNYQVRNTAGVVLNTLFKNPTMVNTQPQPVVPVLTNDTGDVKVLVASVVPAITDTTFICTNVQANLWALTDVQNKMGYEATNFTDLICEGGRVKSILLQVTSGSGSSATTEYFNVPTHYLQTSQFQRTNNNISSFELTTSFSTVTTLRAGTLTVEGTESQIFSSFTNSLVQVNITNIGPVLDINSGNLSTGQPQSGPSNVQQIAAAGQTTIPSNEATAFAAIQANIKVIGIQVELYFDEENLRKTNLAVRVLRNQYTFTVPQGRTVIVDFALQQQDDQETLKTVTTVSTLGNTARQSTLLEDSLNYMYDQLSFMSNNPEITTRNKLPRIMSVTAPIIIPAVAKASLNMNDGKTDVMRESERLSDMKWRFGEALYYSIQQIESQTLLNTMRAPGQNGVYKCITHNTLRGMFFPIKEYHQTLDYPGTNVTGADLSFGLPNGYRVDVVGTNFDTFMNKMIICPVDEKNPSHWTSTATIQDAASYTAVFPYQRYNATSRRIIHNSREILFVPTPVGIILEVTNIEAFINGFSTQFVSFNIPSYNQLT